MVLDPNRNQRQKDVKRSRSGRVRRDLVESENDESEGGERIERVKTEEELQLWALIDMMVQSKTRIKLHMGSLGSKGEFR